MKYQSLLAGAIVALTSCFGTAALAQPFEGCPSKEVLAQFEEFGRTKRMPPEMARQSVPEL